MTLEVGQVLYDNSLQTYVITRVTPKQAVVELTHTEFRFDREQHNPQCIRLKGAEEYSRLYFSTETPELIERKNTAIY